MPRSKQAPEPWHSFLTELDQAATEVGRHDRRKTRWRGKLASTKTQKGVTKKGTADPSTPRPALENRARETAGRCGRDDRARRGNEDAGVGSAPQNTIGAIMKFKRATTRKHNDNRKIGQERDRKG